MSPATGDRFAALVERRLAGLTPVAETEELSGLLASSREAQARFLGAVEVHLDLDSAHVSDATPAPLKPATVLPNARKEGAPMARISLNCTCSWTFFIPSTTTGHEVSCPSCGQSVRIPGRKPGKDLPKSPGEVAAEKQRRQGLLRLIIGAVAALLVAGVTFAVVSRPTPPPEEHVQKSKPTEEKIRPVQKPSTPEARAEENRRTSPATTPLFSESQIEERKRTALEMVLLINMSTVVAEIFRHRNLQEPYDEIESGIALREEKLNSCVADLWKVKETPSIGTHCVRGDQILQFNGSDLQGMKPGEAAQFLHNWAIAWNPGAAIDQAVVSHAGKEVTITLMFPEDSKELLALLRHPALKAEVLSNGQASDRVLMSADLIKRYQSAMGALPAGYQQFIPPHERARIDPLLQRKMASSVDAEWFGKRLLGEILPAFEADVAALRGKISELEPVTKENPAPDAVFLKDRQRLDGKVINEGSGKVRLKFRSGARLLEEEEIDRIELGKGIGSEIQAAVEKSKGSLEKLIATMTLCAGKHLMPEKQQIACQILLLDPCNEKARAASGVLRPQIPGSR